MGSITLTKAKGIWQTLPAPLRGAATLLAVLALAALLTTVRHNASAYLTGVWDTGSQTLVYGRIHQMEQGQYAPGGFLGVYTDDWSDDTNRALFRNDTPTDAAAFHPYTHQSGLQGWLFGGVNRLLRHRLPDGLARETALYWLNSTLFYAAELLVALAVWEEFGPLAAAFGFASVLLAPWLQRGMKDLYWCLWTWLLPLLAALEQKLQSRGLHPLFLTGHTGWTDDLYFAFAHRDKLCSPFKKKVHDPSAPYDAYDESDDTEENAKRGFLPPVQKI